MTSKAWRPALWVTFDDTGPKVTDGQVLTFEKTIERVLPADYRDFLLEVNGGRADDAHCRFRLRKENATLATLFSIDPDNERDDVAMRQLHTRDRPESGILIGYSNVGNIILMVAGPRRGEVWHLTRGARDEDANPRVDWFDRRDVTKVADSFSAFIAGLGPLTDAA